jgi:hypothetical protein
VDGNSDELASRFRWMRARAGRQQQRNRATPRAGCRYGAREDRWERGRESTAHLGTHGGASKLEEDLGRW